MRETILPMTRLAPARITGPRIVLPGSVMSYASVGVWNGRDPILKERLFGLTNSESNHGKDVKEYMNYLYKYPQAAFPYNDLGLPGEHRFGPRRGSFRLFAPGRCAFCSTPSEKSVESIGRPSRSDPRSVRGGLQDGVRFRRPRSRALNKERAHLSSTSGPNSTKPVKLLSGPA